MSDKKTLYCVNKIGGVQEWSVWTESETIIVEHGKLDGKMQRKETICTPKNQGRANETTPEQQAKLEAQSKYNKQYDKYYRKTVEEARELLTEGVMLAQDYTKKPHFLEERFYCSRKLDGLRCKTVFVNGEPEWHSRGGKQYPVPLHLVTQLKVLHEATGVTTLDGEAYVEGYKLQKIQSCVKKTNSLTPKVTYEVFDVPMLNVSFGDRNCVMESFREVTAELPHINIVEQELINKDELEGKLEQYLSENYEGIMMRNSKGMYEFQNKRSNDLLKYKLMSDSECKTLSCKRDKNGQGLFTVDWTNHDTGINVQFELSMNGSHEENTFEKLGKRVGEYVNFKYQDLTEDGVPTFARGLYFRECDEKGKPLE